MKYNKTKIKQQHGIMKEFQWVLQKLATSDAIKRIVPWRIARSQWSSSHYIFSASYPTTSGLKCMMKKWWTAQEVFLIGNADEIRQAIQLLVTWPLLKGF